MAETTIRHSRAVLPTTAGDAAELSTDLGGQQQRQGSKSGGMPSQDDVWRQPDVQLGLGRNTLADLPEHEGQVSALEGLLSLGMLSTDADSEIAELGDVDFQRRMGLSLSVETCAQALVEGRALMQGGNGELKVALADAIGAFETLLVRSQEREAKQLLGVSKSALHQQLEPLVRVTGESLVGQPFRPEAGLAHSLRDLPSNLDIQTLVQWVLRESYLDITKDLFDYANRIRYYNQAKKEIRDRIAEMRQVGSDLAGFDPDHDISHLGLTSDKIVVDYHEYAAMAADDDDAPSRVPRPGSGDSNISRRGFNFRIEKGALIQNKEGYNSYLSNLEEQLQTVGEDQQLAQVDLQNVMQKQQQLLQLMSNTLKMVHDTSMSIIRKIG